MIPFLTGAVHTSSFPQPLNPEEEKECLKKLKSGDKQARNKLIEHNLRLVAHLVKKYDTKEETEDLISIGTIGLIKGIDSFDVDKGLKLTTYISKCIENEILMTLRKQKNQPVVSLDDAIGQDKDGNLIRLFEVIQDTDQVNVIEHMTKQRQKEILYQALNTLDSIEKDILIQRYGLYHHEPKTQKEIAQTYRISRSYVSRIEKRAFIKLLKFFQQT
ncbi:MAG: RNA polymerase sporulation sigma factor SigK [Erysipelotrichaceae bacterium]|nr:RNA polymerase sporulation sigma factor SigK [Erysipelotrichaceae bacterium]